MPKIARQPRRNKAIVAFAACVCLAVLPSAAGAAQETSSGKVAQFLDVPVLLTQSFSNKPPSYCEYWGGKFRTESGQTITFFVETGLSGSPKSAKGLVPTDPGAIRIANTFAIADPEPKDAVLKISYVDSEVRCGETLTNVVKSASLALPRDAPCVVPINLVGQFLADSETELREAHCTVGTITGIKSATARAGTVISSSPDPSTFARPRTAVRLVVSRGPH